VGPPKIALVREPKARQKGLAQRKGGSSNAGSDMQAENFAQTMQTMRPLQSMAAA